MVPLLGSAAVVQWDHANANTNASVCKLLELISRALVVRASISRAPKSVCVCVWMGGGGGGA